VLSCPNRCVRRPSIESRKSVVSTAAARAGCGALLLADAFADYGIPGCERLPVAATMGVVKLTVKGL
jgi:hypothetical protein